MTNPDLDFTIKEVNKRVQLLEAYKRNFVGRVTPRQLQSILRGEHSSVFIRKVLNGTIMCSNGVILTCVHDYYTPMERSKKPILRSAKNPYLKCRKIKEYFSINDDVPDLDCRFCHLTCLELEKTGALKRKGR